MTNRIYIYIVTFKSEQADERIGAVYTNLDDAKAECDRLEQANKYANVSAGVVIRQLELPR